MLEKNKRENDLFTSLLKHFVLNTLCRRLQHTHFRKKFQTYFPFSFAVSKSSSFHEVSRKCLNFSLVWVIGSTHIVLLPKNVIFRKECEENNSPTHRKWTFLLDWNFLWTTMTSEIESRFLSNRFNCRKTKKMNVYSRDYFIRWSLLYYPALNF